MSNKTELFQSSDKEKLLNWRTAPTREKIVALITGSTVCQTAERRAPNAGTGQKGRPACGHTCMVLAHGWCRASSSTNGTF